MFPAGGFLYGGNPSHPGEGDDTASVISFTSSIHSIQNYDSASFGSGSQASATGGGRRLGARGGQGSGGSHAGSRTGCSDDIDTKIECVDSLVSLLGCTDVDKMSRSVSGFTT